MPRLPSPGLPRPPEAVLEAGRRAADLGRDGWDWWLSLSIYTRRRLGVGAGLAAAVALIWAVALPALPCRVPGGESCPPTDHAIDLVPEDALAYVHLDLDPGSDQLEAAEGVASRVPTLARLATDRLVSRLPGPRGAPPDFSRDVEPWLGGEAALAILPSGGRLAEEVQLLRIGDAAGGWRFADAISSARPRSSRYRGVEVRVDRRGLATAIVGGFLAVGTGAGVREVIAAHSGADDAGTLADDPAASAARDALPEPRLADLYISREGATRLARTRSPLAIVASAIDPDATRGTAAALLASDDGLQLALRSILDPARATADSGLTPFRPALPASLPADSLGYLGIGDPGQAIGSLLGAGGAAEAGLATAIGGLGGRLEALADLGLERLAPSLGGEAALALEPSPRGGARTPVLVFIGSGVDEPSASRPLRRLQGPVAAALGAPRGARAFDRRKVGEVTVHSLRLSPTVELTYAIVDRRLVVATDPAAVRRLVAENAGLDDAEAFRQATAGLPGEVSMLGYLNLGAVIGLGERAGLSADPAYATFAPEIRRLRALGLAVRGSRGQLSADLRLVVAEGGEPGGRSQGAPAD
jgi:hypothetical protein